MLVPLVVLLLLCISKPKDFTISLSSFQAKVIGSPVCLVFRKKIVDLANRGANQMNRMLGYHLLPTTIGSFEDDIHDGLTSSQFDLEANLEQHDQRAGLKDKKEILKIMRKQKVSFDEARLIRQQRLLKKNVRRVDEIRLNLQLTFFYVEH